VAPHCRWSVGTLSQLGTVAADHRLHRLHRQPTRQHSRAETASRAGDHIMVSNAGLAVEATARSHRGALCEHLAKCHQLTELPPPDYPFPVD
jgi:hypothetical protein